GAPGPGAPEPDPERLRGPAVRRGGAGHHAARRRSRGGRGRRPRPRRAGGGQRAHIRAVLLDQAIDGARPVDLLLDRHAARGRALRAGPRRRRGELSPAIPGGRGTRCLSGEGARRMSEKRPARGRVLVVEDEGYVRSSLGELLGQRGFDVDLSGSVADALASLARTPVDVVLTDLRMPGADGLDLVKRMQAACPLIPVVVL